MVRKYQEPIKPSEPSETLPKFLIFVIVIGLVIIIIITFSPTKNKETEKASKVENKKSSVKTSRIKSRPIKGVKYEKLIVYPEKWTKKVVPLGYHWTAYRDPTYGEENEDRFLKIAVDHQGIIKAITDKDGKIIDFEYSNSIYDAMTPERQVTYVEFMSGEQKPVYLLYGIYKQ